MQSFIRHSNDPLMPKGQSTKSQMVTKKKVQYVPEQIEDSFETILINQSCKTWIQSLLIPSRPYLNSFKSTMNRISLEPMMFQVYKENILTDLVYSFPCVYQLPIPSISFPRYTYKYQFDRPQLGSFIRIIKMAFDVKQFSLVIFEYQYLGGAGSEMIGGCYQPVKWDFQKINETFRKNIKNKGSIILMESQANEMMQISKQKKSDIFELPGIRLYSAKSMIKRLEHKEEEVEQQKIQAQDQETKAEYQSNSD